MASRSLLSGIIAPRRPASPEQTVALRDSVRKDAGHVPGVYRMLAEDGAVLYVGKSKRLRSRLLSYFRAEGRDKGARILRQTWRIEWDTTPSEFAALLLELRLIKQYRPPFNVVNKRDLSHYAFLRLKAGTAPKLTVHRCSRGRLAGDGHYYGPFLGPERLTQAVHELSDALGLRDCADDVPMHFSDQPELISLGPRAPGCLRYEIKKCLGPCVGGCSARAYEERVALARSFLEGHSEALIEHFRVEMERSSAAQLYERAALYRDRLRRLEGLREQFARLRFALESLSFIYPVPGAAGNDRVYLVRRGTIRAERAAPRSTPDYFDLQRMIDEVYQPGEPARGPVRLHEIDEILLISSWFRRFPEELGRTWTPG